MATICRNNVSQGRVGEAFLIASRTVLFAAIAGCVVLQPFARACAVVVARARRFRGMRRRRRESGDQGSQDRGAFRMQREIRRPPQARRRLYLFRFHAEPEFRYRGTEPDAGRAETHRRAIYRLSRPANGAAASPRPSRQTAAATGCSRRRLQERQAEKMPLPVEAPNKPHAGGERYPAAHQGRQLRAAFVLLRLAAAFGRHQGSEEAVQSRRARRSGAEVSSPSMQPASFPAQAGSKSRTTMRSCPTHDHAS